MTPVPIRPATDILVAIALISSLPGIPAGKVSKNLPKDQTAWAETGFLAVSIVGGAPDIELPQGFAVATVDCYAVALNSRTAPWGKATDLAQDVVAGLRGKVDSRPRDTRPNYGQARVLEAYPVTTPREVTGDASSFARVTVDVAFHWVEVP